FVQHSTLDRRFVESKMCVEGQVWSILSRYEDPKFTVQSEPGGTRFGFARGKRVFVSKCCYCAFERTCSAAEKTSFHHPTRPPQLAASSSPARGAANRHA